ncbi:protein containing Por secretion system C-terminal sorting domain [Lentimicrobium saccharophilum]|jgi:hypothetical protein|uniref:Protein containing Por secretion system C-terminal sorting domain n=1 Tax=Lentimicrobium saccharophilum TaxID=1678841 RepID=A0A0S7BZ41_9BACT|nr:T9SS type A sorting domain-containing protein [Lentimicrobium saccharophilum]GAP43102.1 protein containing Por secretion system C-terminal sorting domain [Lentimicrobium saccharophilum]
MKNSITIAMAVLILLPFSIWGQMWRENPQTEVLDSVITWKFSGISDSILSFRTTYRYDEQKRTIQKEEFVREQALNLWVPYRIEKWQYDGQDRQTMWAVLFWENETMAYKGLFRERYVFDAQGNVSESYFDGWSLSLFDWINYRRILNYYDNQQRLTNEVNFEWNNLGQHWDSTSYILYEYNPEGLPERVTEWEEEDGTGVFYPKLRYDYEYNTTGDMILKTRLFYNHNTQLWYYMVKEEPTWDEHHSKIQSWYWKYEESIEEWIPLEKDHWAWDEAGNMALYEYYRIGEDTVTWMPSIKAEMTYNAFNRMLRNTGYSGNDFGEWEPGYMRAYEYIQDTLLVEDALSQWDAGSASWKGVNMHLYTFDSLNRRHSDSYHKWIVHVQQFVLSTRDYYSWSQQEAQGFDEPGRISAEIMPNPTQGEFQILLSNILYPDCQVEIVDPTGKIREKLKSERGAASILMDITHFPPGIYFVRIESENQIIVKKIIRL